MTLAGRRLLADVALVGVLAWLLAGGHHMGAAESLGRARGELMLMVTALTLGVALSVAG